MAQALLVVHWCLPLVSCVGLPFLLFQPSWILKSNATLVFSLVPAPSLYPNTFAFSSLVKFELVISVIWVAGVQKTKLGIVSFIFTNTIFELCRFVGEKSCSCVNRFCSVQIQRLVATTSSEWVTRIVPRMLGGG